MAKKGCVLILAATIAALALRLPRLEQRPMHGDEAVHAIKFEDLLEKGVYEYDPEEYHGPTLNYLTLIPAKLTGAESLAQVNEFTLRIVPVVFGVCLVLLLLLVIDGLGAAAAVYAAVLTAISAAMVFYSRYYIQEILLVCFTFGAIASGYRYTRSKNIAWALLTGAFLGLTHATKETCIIVFGSMFLAVLLTLLTGRPKGSLSNAAKAVKPSHLIAGIAAGVIVSGLFFSSFEGLIVFLAAVGFIAAMLRKGPASANTQLLRFIAFYTLILTVIYSAVPYKTPWCVLGFLHGMILLAGVGTVVLVRLVPNVLPRLIILCLLFDASVHLGWQAYRCSYRYDADSRNPYVYAHPTKEVFTVVQRVEEMAGALEKMALENPDTVKMHIQVICPGKDYWPLPWYFRRFEKDVIGWWDKIDPNTPSAPLIIASPEVEAELTNKLYNLTPLEDRQMYLFLFEKPYYMWLRPKIKLLGFVKKDLWNYYHRQQTKAAIESAK
jgi:predicted membrane-bound mannosyltransferase